MTVRVSRTAAWVILSGVILFLLLLKVIPVFVDKEALRLSIEKGLRESTGVQFRIEEISVDSTLFQGLQVHLNTSTITDMNKNPLGNIDNITVQIRYLPLFLDQLPEIAKIHINHVYIPVSDRSLFSELRLKLTKPKRTGFLKPAEMKDTEILLTNFLIEDLEVPDAVRKIIPKARQFRVEGGEISIRHLQSDQNIAILARGKAIYTTGPGLKEAGEQKNVRMPLAGFKALIELPPDAFEEGRTLAAADLGRLNLDLRGPQLDAKLRYEHKKDRPGVGNLDTRATNPIQAQVMAIQMGDTFALPIPDALFRLYLAGAATIDSSVQVDYSRHPNRPTFALKGQARLRELSLVWPEDWPRAALSHINGTVRLNSDAMDLRDLRVQLSSLPLQINGIYRLNSGRMNLRVRGNDLRMASLKQTLRDLGGPPDPLQGRDLTGRVDVSAHLTGTADSPVYRGMLSLKEGTYQDTGQGLNIRNVDGRFNFSGIGLETPVIKYDGQLVIHNGRIDSQANNLLVNRFDGRIQASGRVSPGQAVTMPNASGVINVRDARYTHPETGLPVQDMHGLLRLAGTVIRVEGFRGRLGNANFLAEGTVTPDLAHPTASRYNIRITSKNINLQRFKTEVLAKIPKARPLMAQLQPYGGLADLDVTASTGAKLNGRLNVSNLALATGMETYPVKIPRLSVVFNNNRITVPDTTVYYGTVALRLKGDFQRPGTYRFEVDSDAIPVDLLRDNSELLTMLSGMKLPEIWNTAGNFGLHGILSNAATSVELDFHNAGLSWRDGDFPLYGLNGRLIYRKTGKGKPVIATRNLNFRYGNSPVDVNIQNQERFSFRSDGILSALVVNHFLVSPQSEATPYREIPFHAAAQGILAALPGAPGEEGNNVISDIHLNLNRTFKDAYKNVSQPVNAPSGVSHASIGAQPIEELPPPDEEQDMTSEPAGGRRTGGGLRPIQALQSRIGLVKEKVESGLEILTHPGAYLEKRTLVQRDTPAIETENPAAPPPEAVAPVVAELGGDNAYIDARLHLAGSTLQVEHAVAHMFEGGNLLAQGMIQEAFDESQRRYDLHLFTSPEISLDKLSHGTSENDFFRNAGGTVGGDLRVQGASGVLPDAAVGWIATNKIAIPYLTIQDLSGKVNINGRAATAEISSFRIPGVTASIQASSEDIFELPMTLENVRIHGSLLSIPSLTDFNDRVVNPIIVDQLVHNFSRPWQQGDPHLPIQFRNGDVQFDETIYQNIIMNNLTSKLSVYANSFFELTNTRLEAAGGKVHGYLSMNPNENNFLTLELNADDVSANALTRALLNVTNQIFGDLDGTVRFTTFGETDDEMLGNANGTVSMKVRNGRLPAIAKVETLLATANVIRGGLLNLNLGNLFRSLTFYDTNYFAELSGDMLVANRVLYTENLVSDGIDLDLFIQGSLRMDTGAADMLVNGRMSQDVTGALGQLGKLSLGRLIRWIPAIGTLGQGRTGLLGYIPGVGYVPGFGGPVGDFNSFQVRLMGRLDNPGAISDFHWVRSPQNL